MRLRERAHVDPGQVVRSGSKHAGNLADQFSFSNACRPEEEDIGQRPGLIIQPRFGYGN
ncbi:hypothetical protein D9M72_107860 [compost metagenome]